MGKSFAPPIALDMVAQGIRYSKELWDAYATKKRLMLDVYDFSTYFSQIRQVLSHDRTD